MIESRNRRDPTMEERPGLDLDVDDDEETNDQKLYQLFKNLEQEWDFIKKRPEKILHHVSSTGSSKMVKTLGLLESSPRKLMYSLQNRISPHPSSEEVAWKVRTNDLAIQEILTERRAAIRSGKLKGRRLFEEDVTETGFGRLESDDEDECNGLETDCLVQESEVRSVFSYESDIYEDENWEPNQVLSPPRPHCCSYSSSMSSSSSSSSSSLSAYQNDKIRGGIEVAKLEGNRIIACELRSRRVRWKVIMVWVVAIVLVACMLGIISRTINFNFGLYQDEEMILVPT